MGEGCERSGGLTQPCVSVIVPVYNTKDCLGRCVKSLLDQTLRDLEVVLVDDGSTDGSAELCDRWAQVDARVHALHKENGGLSAARNYGALAARAPWIGFVDSDDYVDLRMFKTLLDDLTRTGADIATCDVLDVYEGEGGFAPQSPSGSCEEGAPAWVMTAEEAVRGMVRSELPRIWVPTRLYPKSLFTDGFAFPVGKTYEDAYTIVDIFARYRAVSVNPAQFYYYCHRPGSITTASYGPRTRDVVDAWEHVRSVARERFPSLDDDIAFRCFWARCVVLDKMACDKRMVGSPEEREMVAYLREHYASVKSHPSLTRSRKLMTRLALTCLPAYRIVVRLASR